MQKLITVIALLFLLVGCSYTGNVALTEKTYQPRGECNVKIFGDFSDIEREYVKLSLVSHKTYLSIIALLENEQKRINKELEKLKVEACKLGADGIVLTEIVPATNDLAGRTFAKASGTAIRFK